MVFPASLLFLEHAHGVVVRDPATGRRKRKWHSFKGTKREAQIESAKLIAAVGKDDYVEPSKATVADFVSLRIDQWEATGDISTSTAESQRGLLAHHAASRHQSAAQAATTRHRGMAHGAA
jgi:hypothetical protein